MVKVIEINDYQLTLLQAKQRIVEIGFAQIEGENLLFSEQAYHCAKKAPQHSYNRYWHDLGYEVINDDNKSIRHFADLAFLQLQHLLSTVEKNAEVIFIVATGVSQSYLSLLLGLAQACQLNVLSLVDASVIRLANSNAQSRVQFIDIQLHVCTQSKLHVDETVTVQSSFNVEGKGILGLYQHLAVWINKLFINKYRFDLFYSAATEQILYSRLPQLLKNKIIDNGENKDEIIEIAEKKIVLSMAQLNEQISHFFQPIFKGVNKNERVYFSQRFAALVDTNFNEFNWQVINDEQLYQQVISQPKLLDKKTAVAFVDCLTHIKPSLLANTLTVKVVDNNHLTAPLKTNSEVSHIVNQGKAFPLPVVDAPHCCYLSSLNQGVISLQKEEHSQAELIYLQNQWQVKALNHSQVLVNGRLIKQNEQIKQGAIIELEAVSAVLPIASFMCIYVEKELIVNAR